MYVYVCRCVCMCVNARICNPNISTKKDFNTSLKGYNLSFSSHIPLFTKFMQEIYRRETRTFYGRIAILVWNTAV